MKNRYRKRRKINVLFCAGVCTLCVLLTGERLTGALIHLLIGLLLVIVASVHMKTCLRRIGCYPAKLRMAAWISFAGMALAAVSGMMLHAMSGVTEVKILHKTSSLLFLVGLALHVGLHRKFRQRGEKEYVS